MIGKLSGIIDSFGEKHLILDVQGVGYVLNASTRTLSRIGQKGDPVSLLVDTQVREDAITLYGFADAGEQQWFRLLNSVQGVGAKVALALLATCPPERLQVIIAAQDKGGLTQADGVGPKLATRILTELKDRAAKMTIGSISVATENKDQQQRSELSQDSISTADQDAVSALVNLGYGRADAYSAVMQAKGKNDNEQESVPVLIRLALKELSA